MKKPPASAGVCVYSVALGYRQQTHYNKITPARKEVTLIMANNRLYQLSHCTYTCQYHLVWTPKYRGKVMADKYIKAELKRIFKQICRWKGLSIHQWHIGDEHIHLYASIPPKYSIAYIMSILKGKSSTWIKKKTKKIPRGTFWARGYFVSTIGIDEHAIRQYIKNQQQYQKEMPKLPF